MVFKTGYHSFAVDAKGAIWVEVARSNPRNGLLVSFWIPLNPPPKRKEGRCSGNQRKPKFLLRFGSFPSDEPQLMVTTRNRLLETQLEER